MIRIEQIEEKKKMLLRGVPRRQFRSAAAGAAILALVLGFATAAGATPLLLATSEPVLMIDGTGDSDGSVTVGVLDTVRGFEFGFFDDGFNLILADRQVIGTYAFAGGSVVDFAIRDAATSEIHRLSDGIAKMYFMGDVLAEGSENPVVPFDYWNALLITWSFGDYDVAFNIGGRRDGFAPASIQNATPEPGAALLFGVGFVVVGWAVGRDVSA